MAINQMLLKKTGSWEFLLFNLKYFKHINIVIKQYDIQFRFLRRKNKKFDFLINS